MLMWRSTHEALAREAQRTIADLRAEKRQLLKAILRMKAQGATLAPKSPKGATMQAPADPFATAIEARAQGDVRMARVLRLRVEQALADGMSEADIVERIHRGDPDEE